MGRVWELCFHTSEEVPLFNNDHLNQLNSRIEHKQKPRPGWTRPSSYLRLSVLLIAEIWALRATMNIQATVLAFFRNRINSPGSGIKTLFATRTRDKRKIDYGGETEKTIGDQKKEERQTHDFTDPEQYQGQRNGDEKHSQ